jgi:hypothetical protein
MPLTRRRRSLRESQLTRRIRRGAGRTAVVAAVAGAAAAAILTAVSAPALAAAADPAATTTTTTVTASPDPVAVGGAATLTATETAADATHPAGQIQFVLNGADIGSPVAVNSGGVATMMTTFTSAGPQTVQAVFIPAAGTSYAESTGTGTETAQAADPAAGAEPVAVTVPIAGIFTVTVAPGTVPLSATGLTATGTLQDVTVSDTRNYYPGWAVYGQQANFAGSASAAGSAISGNQLGWAPVAVDTLADGATLGPSVAPVSPGLGSVPGTLAYAGAGCGFGTNVLSAGLTLDIPAATVAGPYSGNLTITYIETQPPGVAGCESVGVGVGGTF